LSSHEDSHKDQLLTQLQSSMETLFMKLKNEAQHTNDMDNLADGQIFVLLNLNRKGVCNATDIANMIGITSGAVTGMTDKLVSMGLITRERSDTDRRVVLFMITDKGKETIQRIRDRRFNRLTEIFRQINNDEIQSTIDVFNKITELLGNR
jgi:DNA-binding MarR family transcriptional regulator